MKRLVLLAALFASAAFGLQPVAAQTCASSASPSSESGTAGDWLSLKREGENALSRNNYGAAERALLPALKEAEKFGPGDIRLADTLHSLAGLYCVRGQFAKAEPLYERELRVREKALGAESPDVVATVGKLAQFYLNHGSAQKADRLATLLVNFADKKIKDQQALKDGLTKLDHYYVQSAGYGEARNLLQKLQTETQRTTANEDLELATTLDSIGHMYKSRGKYEIAERMYKNALSFRERTLSPEHLALAASYDNLASLYQAEGKNSQAEPLFKKALEVTEKTLQPGRPEVFNRLDELAQTYISLGQPAQAEALYKRALQVLEKGQAKGDVGKASMALANLYIKQGRYGAAEPLVKRALIITENTNGPQHASVANVLDSYAEVLEHLSRNGEASRARARARSIRGVVVVDRTGGDDF